MANLWLLSRSFVRATLRPDHEIGVGGGGRGGAAVSKIIFFWTFGLYFGLKVRGQGAGTPGPSPGYPH